MIISASRRTDIPAFYSSWFENRIREGMVSVPNPFNPRQVSEIPLSPEAVDAIVFWTRYSRPIHSFLPLLAKRYRFYFLFTLMDNPRFLDPKMPPLKNRIETFRRLADLIGPEKVVWRYDPIVFTNRTDHGFHRETYEKIASALRGYTKRSIISVVDLYRKLKPRMEALKREGVILDPDPRPGLFSLFSAMKEIAKDNRMEIFSCVEDLSPFGIHPGKCIDDDMLSGIFGGVWEKKKDPHQRKKCNCVISRDIGIYDTCLFECRYCYATGSFERARQNYRVHDPASRFLINARILSPSGQG